MRGLLKALLTTGGATIVAQILGLIVNKILALSIGASGIGFYSLMRQAHDTATGLASIGAGGLVQGLASREGAARARLWWGAIALTLFGATIAAMALLTADRDIARLLFDRDDDIATTAIALCGITTVLGVVHATFAAGVNAARAITALALLGVAGAAIAALIAWPVAQAAQSQLSFLAVLIGTPLLVQLLATFVVLRRVGWLPDSPRRPENRPGRAEFGYFAGFFGFNLILGVAGAISLLFIRSSIVHADGLVAAGLFAAGWGIGMQSVSLVLSAFGTYIVPGIAAADAEGRRRLMQDAATVILALSLPLLVGLIAWKPLVLRALFSEEFLPAVVLLQWLLLGNWLKLLSWVLAVPFPATADLRRFLPMELGWYVVFTAGCAIAVTQHEVLAGIGMAFFAAYLFYLIFAGWMTRRRFGFQLSWRSAASFLAGLLVLVATAILTWNAQTMDWSVAFVAPIAAAIVSFVTLTPSHRAKGWMLMRSRWRQ